MNEPCQNTLVSYGSSRVPRLIVWLRQAKYYLRQDGLRLTVGRILSFLASRTREFLGGMKTANHWSPAIVVPVPASEVLDLRAGDLVEVKSENEIRETLNEHGRHRGLAFTPDMREYCGKRLRVFKRVERICMECNPDEVRRLTNTVILEGAICQGGSRGCDRSCFFFWREAWLKRVSGDPPSAS